ncbi:endolytic transglycosylase MltG, partial [Psychrobacter sp. T6-1]
MSTPTPPIPPNKTDDTDDTSPNTRIDDAGYDNNTADSVTDASTDASLYDDTQDKAPITDVSLISGQTKPRKYKKDNPSFFMQRGYQILLVLGLIAAFLLVMVYQTLFGRLDQPAQKVTIEQGDTYYGLLPQWQQQIPLFSATIGKLYIKSQVDAPLHAGIYQLPENPTMAEVLHVLEQGAKVAMVKV